MGSGGRREVSRELRPGPAGRLLRWVRRALDAAGLPAVPPPIRPQELPDIDLDDVAPPTKEPLRVITELQSLPPRPDAPQDDLGALLRIVAHLKPERVLELGTAHGNATANICANSSAHVYTVNAEPEQIRSRTPTQFIPRDRIGEVYRRHGFAERVTQIIGDTLELDLAVEPAGEPVDLAIIDACHDPRHVIRDFHAVQPVLRHGAAVLLHDTHPSGFKHLWGSTRACLRLRCQGFDIRHIRGTWWGYWRKSRREDVKRSLADIARRFTARLSRSGRGEPSQSYEAVAEARESAPSGPTALPSDDQTARDVETTYLFALCPPFSGSTLLWELLATSPAVSAFPREGQFLPEVRDWMERKRWDPDKHMPWEKIKKQWDRIWDPRLPIHLEKSPAHIVRAEQIERHFRPAAFVAMIRNPYALCHGLRRRQGRRPQEAADMWVRWARYQMENIRRLQRVLFFTYEELTGHPERVKRRILEFLPALGDVEIDRPFEAASYASRSPRRIRNLNQPKIDLLPGRYIRGVNEVLRRNEDVMRFFGYEFLEPSLRHAARHVWATLRHRVASLAAFLAPPRRPVR